MDFSHYSDTPVQVAVDLVNTLDVVSSEENLNTPGDVADFIETGVSDWDRVEFSPTERDLHETRALRARLREVFDAPDAAGAAETLNALLADVHAVPRVSVHGDTPPHLHFEPESGGVARWLGAITAMGLSVALIEGGFNRFGHCASDTCDDVFVDTSKNRSRRHCSDTCTTRESVAAYRARQRAGHPTR